MKLLSTVHRFKLRDEEETVKASTEINSKEQIGTHNKENNFMMILLSEPLL